MGGGTPHLAWWCLPCLTLALALTAHAANTTVTSSEPAGCRACHDAAALHRLTGFFVGSRAAAAQNLSPGRLEGPFSCQIAGCQGVHRASGAGVGREALRAPSPGIPCPGMGSVGPCSRLRDGSEGEPGHGPLAHGPRCWPPAPAAASILAAFTAEITNWAEFSAANGYIWNSSVPTCLWKGVTCSGTGLLTQLSLQCSSCAVQAQGSLYAGLTGLTTLTSLNLQGNQFSGGLPVEWGAQDAFPSLQYLYALCRRGYGDWTWGRRGCVGAVHRPLQSSGARAATAPMRLRPCSPGHVSW